MRAANSTDSTTTSSPTTSSSSSSSSSEADGIETLTCSVPPPRMPMAVVSMPPASARTPFSVSSSGVWSLRSGVTAWSPGKVGPQWPPSRLPGRADDDQKVAGLHLLRAREGDPLHHSVDGRRDRGLHLHRLDRRDGLSRRDGGAGLGLDRHDTRERRGDLAGARRVGLLGLPGLHLDAAVSHVDRAELSV